MKTEVCKTDQVKRSWYNNSTFPIIPLLTTRKADDHNTSSFSFYWLFFKLWSLDATDFEITFTISGHWGIGIIGLLPYLRFVITIPCPEKFSIWLQRKTWRRV